MARTKPTRRTRGTRTAPSQGSLRQATATTSRTIPSESAAQKPAAGAIEPAAGGKQTTSESSEPAALVVTHSFDSGSAGEPYAATIRLTGSRSGVSGKPTAADSLAQTDSVPGIVPGIGRVSVSSWIYGINPGLWTVTAELIRPASAAGDNHRRAKDGASVERLQPAAWSWRHWAAQPTTRGEVKTRWAMLAPLARIPAVQPGSWPLLAGLGAVIGLLVQAAVAGGWR